MATNQPKQSSPNKNAIYLGVLFLLVGVGGTYQFLTPRLTDARERLAQSQAKLKGIETDISVLTTAKAKLDDALKKMEEEREVDFARVPLVYPKTEDVPGLYLQMEALMNQSAAYGVSQPLYQVSTPVMDPVENNVHIPVTISAVGGYPQLRQFIENMERNLRPLTITTINLSQTLDKDKGTPNGQFTINMAAVIRAQGLSAAYTSAGAASN